MYVHLGGNIVIKDSDIIAIFDMETKNLSKDTENFLNVADDEGFIVKITDDNPKSFIITERDKKSVIFLSPISSLTIIKRTEKYNN